MLVERNFFEIRPGCIEEAVSILKAEIERLKAEGSKVEFRVLTPVFAPFDLMISEHRYSSLTEIDQFWMNWLESGAGANFFQKIDPLRTGNGRREVWGVHEPVQLSQTGKYVNWRAGRVKPVQWGKAMEMLVAERGNSNRYQLLYSIYGPGDAVVMAFEFDSLDAYLQEWEEWGSKDTTSAFMENWVALIDPGGVNEVWQVA